MAFWRSWVRALLGASGVTLLVPVGLVLAVTLAATLGGGGFGGLGQLVSGPGLPGAEPVGAGVGGASNGGVPALPAGATTTSASHSARRASEPAHPAVPGGHRAATPSRGQGIGGSVPTTKPTGTSTETHKPPSTGGGGSPGQKPPSSPSPITPVVEPITTPVRGTLKTIGDAVEKTLKNVPVVGQPLADVVGTVVDLLSAPTPQQGR
jgi:hypothetical protein